MTALLLRVTKKRRGENVRESDKGNARHRASPLASLLGGFQRLRTPDREKRSPVAHFLTRVEVGKRLLAAMTSSRVLFRAIKAATALNGVDQFNCRLRLRSCRPPTVPRHDFAVGLASAIPVCRRPCPSGCRRRVRSMFGIRMER